MIGLGLLVVVLFVVLLVVLVSRVRRDGQALEPPRIDPLAAQLRRWVADGLITEEQAAAILTAEHAPVPRPAAPTRPVSVAVELFGYLGGTLAIIGAALLAARFWQDLTVSTRLLVLGLVAMALWAAGVAIHEHADPALGRLRGVLWLLSSAAVAFFTALLGADALSLSDESVALTTGLATAVYGGLLWWRRPRPLQQLACLAGVLAAVGGAIAVIGWGETAVGLGIWAVGLGWVLLGWRALLPPTAVALLAGAAVMLLGAQAVAGGWEAAGLLLGLGSTAALLAVGTTGRRLALAGVGIVGVVMFLPATVVHFFPGTVGVPVLILLTGAALLAVTLVMLRVHPSWSHGTGSSRSDSTAGSHPA
jgi:hypothetical protein